MSAAEWCGCAEQGVCNSVIIHDPSRHVWPIILTPKRTNFGHDKNRPDDDSADKDKQSINRTNGSTKASTTAGAINSTLISHDNSRYRSKAAATRHFHGR